VIVRVWGAGVGNLDALDCPLAGAGVVLAPGVADLEGAPATELCPGVAEGDGLGFAVTVAGEPAGLCR
jgi:hypothetical protein